MRRIVLAALAVIAFLTVCGVLWKYAFPQGQATPVQTQGPAPAVGAVEPVDDGNGVLYFPATGDQYRRSLAKFYEANPGKHCDLQGVTQDVHDEGFLDQRVVYTPITGFILHCHDIAVNAQDVTVQ